MPESRVARTAVQATVGGAFVTIFEFIAAYPDWDLDPRTDGVQDSLPTAFTAALFIVISTIAAWWMNRKPVEDPVEPVVEAPAPVTPPEGFSQ